MFDSSIKDVRKYVELNVFRLPAYSLAWISSFEGENIGREWYLLQQIDR